MKSKQLHQMWVNNQARFEAGGFSVPASEPKSSVMASECD